MDGNDLTGTIDSSFASLPLTHFSLSYNSLSGPLPFGDTFKNLTRLEFLDLSGNMFTGSVKMEMLLLPNLEAFVAGENRLSGSLAPIKGAALDYPLRLDRLDLSENQMTGTLPSILGALPLGDLVLSNNRFTGERESL